MRWLSATVKLSLLGVALHSLTGATCAQGEGESSNTAIIPAPRDGHAQELHEQYLERAARGEIDLLFLGDSITEGWNEFHPSWKRHFSKRNAANFGIGGDRTQHVLWRLENGEIAGIQPRVVVLMIGTNNIGQNSAEEIAEGVEAIVEKLKTGLPGTRILLLGVFPRGSAESPDQTEVEPDPRVGQVNAIIKGLGDGERVTYLDIGAAFLNEDGKIPRDLMPDFLHLSRAGYWTWAEAMEPTLWELLEQPRT